jgi:C_GCAxxG_C_C family probable redox protein
MTMAPEQIIEVRRSAEDCFSSGLYCAESALLALADAQGIDSELLPRIASAFCSGMARTCGTCGALTGAMMGIGLALGRSEANQSLQPAYVATQRLVREFEQAFGTRACHELLGCDLATAEGQAFFRDNRLGERCLKYTGTAAEMAARIISETSPKS